MFRFMRDSEKVKKYLLIFFLGIVSVGMVITLAPIPTGDTARVDNNSLAVIGGRKITAQEVRHTLEARLRNSQYGNNSQIAAAMAPILLDDMIQQEEIELQAQKLGIEASPQEVRQAAEAQPGLYENGAFIGRERLEQVTGMTLEQIESELAQSIVAQKMQAIITDGIRVTPEEVRAEFVKRNTKAKIEYVLFDPSQYIGAVKVTPEALEAFYKKDPSRYKIPEERRVRYVLVDSDRLRAQARASDDDVRRYYNQHLSDYRVPERVKVASILFKTTGKTPGEVATLEKTASDVLAQSKSGMDFGELAKRYSEDTTSAQKGGEIGWIVRNQTVEAVEDAAFSMSPGQVSDLIKTTYGIHIIKVLDKQTAHLQTMDEVKGAIRADLERQKMDQVQQTYGDDLEHKLRVDPKAFESVAKSAGLEVKETPLFKYKEILPDFGNSEAFANLAFQLRQGEVGQRISVPKGMAIIQLAAVVPEHFAKLDEVRAQVEQDYRAAQSRVLAADAAREFAEKCKTQDYSAVARAMKLTPKESKDFAQPDYVENVASGSALAAAFTLPEGNTSDVVPAGANQVVFRVLSHTPANDADFAAQKDQISEEITDQKRSLAFEVYKKNLKAQLLRSGELKINDAAMKEFVAVYQGRS